MSKAELKIRFRNQFVYPLCLYVLIYHIFAVVLVVILSLPAMTAYLISACICLFLLYRIYRDEIILDRRNLSLQKDKGLQQSILLKQEDRKKEVLRNIGFILITVIFGILVNLLISYLLPYISTDRFEASQETLEDGAFWIRILASGIVIPLLEETLFRGLIGEFLQHSLNLWLAVILSSFIFGLFHFNLIQGIYGFLVGLFLCFSYLKSGKLLVPMISHISLNLIVLFYSAVLGG